jgi:Zn-dependent hydrolases, including glyoxylases
MLEVLAFPSGPYATNAYLVFSPETRYAYIIDPAAGSTAPIVDTINKKQLKPQAILLTHSHLDHTADAAGLKEALHIPLYVHERDAKNVTHPGSDGLGMFIFTKATSVDHFLKDGEELKVDGIRFLVIHTPGHTPGGVCFYAPDDALLISGDTLFQRSIGNLSFPTCSSSDMWRSLERLAILPPQVVVFPGHGASTTIGEEKEMMLHAKRIFGGK